MAKKPSKAKAKEVKTHAHSSPRALSVKGTDPSKVYRFVRTDDTSIGMREQAGWITSENSELYGPGKRKGSSGSVATHDLVLMEIDKDLHDQIKKIPGQRSRQRVEGAMFSGGEEMEKTETTHDHLQGAGDSDKIFE